MLVNSGSDFAKKYIQINNLYIRDKDGNILQEESKKIEDGIAKLYNQLFQYLSDKLISANVKTTIPIAGTHITGPFTGAVVPGKVTIKIK